MRNVRFFLITLSLLTLSSLVHAQPEGVPIPDQSPDTMTAWEMIFDAAKGSAIIILPLFLLSVVGVMLVFYFFFALTKGRIASNKFVRSSEALISKGDYLGLLALSNRTNQAAAQVVGKSVDFITKNPEAEFDTVREVAQAEGTRQASSLNQQISYLADIGAIAPMLGLLGTVIGMIRSFSVLAADVSGSRPMLLAEGVSQALITTAAGLFVGIPAMMAYAYFRGRVQSLIAELENASTYIISLLALSYKKKVVNTEESADIF